jgi:hypothetical protein
MFIGFAPSKPLRLHPDTHGLFDMAPRVDRLLQLAILAG